MSANAFTLRILIQVPPSNAPKEAKRVNKSLLNIKKTAGATAKSVGNDFRALAGAFTTLVVAKRVKDAIVGMVAPAIDFEDALNKVKVTTNVTEAELTKLKKAALNAAEATAFSPEEAVEGMRALRKATANTEATLTALEPVLAFAAVAEIEAGDAASIAGDALTTFADVNVKNLGDKLSELKAVSTVLRADFKDVLPIMGRLGIAGTKVGGSFRDMVIAFQIARSSGAASARVMTSLNRFVTEMGDPKKRLALQELFGPVFLDAEKNVRPLPLILADLSAGIKGSSFEVSELGAKLTKTLGLRAAKVVFQTLTVLKKGLVGLPPGARKGAAAIAELNRIMAKAPPITDALAERNKTAAVSLERMKQAATILLITIGEPLLAPIVAVANGIRRMISAINEAITENTIFGAILGFITTRLIGLVSIVGGGIFLFAAARAAIVLLGVAFRFSGFNAIFNARSVAFLTSWIGANSVAAFQAARAQVVFATSLTVARIENWALAAAASGSTFAMLAAKVATWGLTFATRALGFAIRFLIPGIGILLVAASILIPTFIDLGSESKEMGKSLESLSAESIPKLTESFKDAALETSGTLKEFRKFIKATSKVLEFDRPKIDIRPLEKTLVVAKKLFKAGKISADTFREMGINVNEGVALFERAVKGEEIGVEGFKKLNKVFRVSGVFIERTAFGMKGLRKDLAKGGEAAVKATSQEAKLNAEVARSLGLTKRGRADFVTARLAATKLKAETAARGPLAESRVFLGTDPLVVEAAKGTAAIRAREAAAAAPRADVPISIATPVPGVPTFGTAAGPFKFEVKMDLTTDSIRPAVEAVLRDADDRIIGSGTGRPETE